jgi:murein DD-endopeptidase MepM/ murein hydrolase activator NlpD
VNTAQFIEGVMQGLGLSGQNARAFFIGLAGAEGTKARNNPFATTRTLGRGEKSINSHGVKSYKSAQDGIDATVATFKLGYYKEVRRLLRADAPVSDTAKALSRSPYVGGSQSVRDKHAQNIVTRSKNTSYESPALSGNQDTAQFASATTASPESIIAKAALGQAAYKDLGGVQAHKSRPLGNWQSDNAFDLGVPVGTPVYATEAGTIGPQVGGMASRPNDGKRVTLNGQSNNYWYGHLSKTVVKPGQTVAKGDLIGYSGKSANGAAHLHIGVENLAAIPSLEQGAPDTGGGAAPLDAGTAPVVFPFEDPALQSPFPEPGSVDIPAPGRNYAETWKQIGSQSYADPLSKEYGSLLG